MVSVMNLTGYVVVEHHHHPQDAVFPIIGAHVMGMYALVLVVGDADRPDRPHAGAGRRAAGDGGVDDGAAVDRERAGDGGAAVRARRRLEPLVRGRHRAAGRRTSPVERGKLLGFNDLLSALLGATLALLGGYGLDSSALPRWRWARPRSWPSPIAWILWSSHRSRRQRVLSRLGMLLAGPSIATNFSRSAGPASPAAWRPGSGAARRSGYGCRASRRRLGRPARDRTRGQIVRHLRHALGVVGRVPASVRPRPLDLAQAGRPHLAACDQPLGLRPVHLRPAAPGRPRREPLQPPRSSRLRAGRRSSRGRLPARALPGGHRSDAGTLACELQPEAGRVRRRCLKPRLPFGRRAEREHRQLDGRHDLRPHPGVLRVHQHVGRQPCVHRPAQHLHLHGGRVVESDRQIGVGDVATMVKPYAQLRTRPTAAPSTAPPRRRTRRRTRRRRSASSAAAASGSARVRPAPRGR